jgi:hypothetical protein
VILRDESGRFPVIGYIQSHCRSLGGDVFANRRDKNPSALNDAGRPLCSRSGPPRSNSKANSGKDQRASERGQP